MSNIKRYKLTLKGETMSALRAELEENENGAWVRYDDIKHLLKTSHNSDSAKCDSCETCLHEDCLSCKSGENYRFE